MVKSFEEYCREGGCGAKIPMEELTDILKYTHIDLFNKDCPNLLVDNSTSDDAAAYALSDDIDKDEFLDYQVVLSTADFFPPPVDCPADFGAIAAANALSDIYAMGGKPIMALSLLGLPGDLSNDVGFSIMTGAVSICQKAKVPIAGGHSIRSVQPLFGLAVTGTVPKSRLIKNSTAKVDDLIYLSKPLRLGDFKKGEFAYSEALEVMTTLNDFGSVVDSKYCNAMTDVTGFGLVGHLLEVLKASGGLGAELTFEGLRKGAIVTKHKELSCTGLTRNRRAYSGFVTSPPLVEKAENYYQSIDYSDFLYYPQTSGPLLMFINPQFDKEFQEQFLNHTKRIGLLYIGKVEKIPGISFSESSIKV